MPTTYTAAPASLLQQLDAVRRRKRPDLVEAGVTFLLQMVHAPRNDLGIATGPALKHHGVPAAAIVSIISLKDRQAGLADVRILFDGDAWDSRHEKEQESVIYHELLHVLLKRDKDERIETDDAGRPKIQLRPHDLEMGVFYEAMEEYKEFALETQVAATVARKLVQLDLPWG